MEAKRSRPNAFETLSCCKNTADAVPGAESARAWVDSVPPAWWVVLSMQCRVRRRVMVRAAARTAGTFGVVFLARELGNGR